MATRGLTRVRTGRARRWATLAVAVGVVAGGALVPTPAHAVVASADLSVSITHGPGAPITGDEITFTVTAANAGPDPAARVVIGLSLGYPLEFVSGSAGCEVASYDAPAVLCEVGTLASGASAVRTITVKPFGAGVYTLPAAVSSTTADPDTADLSASDTVIVRKGPLQGERYVRGEFPKVFGRAPDQSTVDYWAGRFKAASNVYPSRIVEIPSSWLQSTEYRRARIREAFTRILGRAASSSEVTYWTARSADLSYEAIERRLLTSAEFRSDHPGDAIHTAIHQAVLGRAASAQEVAASKAKLAGGASLASVVRGIQRSTEGFDRIIDQRYQQVLGRAPDALGRYVWQVRLRNGYTPERLTGQLLVSNPILQQYPRTSDDYGESYYEEDQAVDGTDPATGLPVYDFTS